MRLISMSVWGNQAMYWEGALRNAELYRSIYPGWDLRVYTDQESIYTEELKKRGADVRVEANLGGIHGMFWRFLPASEPGLDALIVRDADSRLNAREAAAVAAWLDSAKAAHVMRDHPHHLLWPMLGGMWGIRGGVIKNMPELIQKWGKWEKKLDDMYFLGHIIWPMIRNDCLQHCRGVSPHGGEEFPSHPPSESDYVGQVFYAGDVKDAQR